jgi:deoxyribonuclease V
MNAGEARELQRTLAPRVSCQSALPGDVRYIAGTDISSPGADGRVRAAVVILEYPALRVEEVSLAEGLPGMPYVPGLLSFRETPVLVKALESLRRTPDLIIVDGQGLAHPRSFGVACHVGLIADTPTIGCGKSRLTGRHGPLPVEAGSRAELINKGRVVGMAVRTRTDVSPVFVSVGHKVDLDSAVKWVLACCRGRRIPDTTKLAHQAAAGRLTAAATQ